MYIKLKYVYILLCQIICICTNWFFLYYLKLKVKEVNNVFVRVHQLDSCVSDRTFLPWKYYLLAFLHLLKLSCAASRLADWLKWVVDPRSSYIFPPVLSIRNLCVRSAANRETAFPHSQWSKRWKLYYSLRTTIKRIRLRSAAHRSVKDPLDSGSRRIDGKWMPEAASGYLIFGYHADRVVEVTE